MSGKCLPRLGKTTTWSSEWGDPPSASNIETSDTVSQISDHSVDGQSSADVGDVKQRLCKLFEDQLYTDVLFYPKNNPTSSISAHRALLAVGSPLFAKMLFGDESNDTASIKLRVQINNISFEAFSNIVKYLYTDDIFLESDELVQDILEGAKQFQIYSLVNRCNSYFQNLKLTEHNVFYKLQMSIANKLGVLKDRCLEYIQENTFKVIKSADFQKCSASTVRTICKLHSLNLRSEVELLEAVMSWLNSQPPVNRRQQIEQLLKRIRFLNFTVTELSSIIKKYPDLLTPNDGLQIMVYLSNPPRITDFKSLPAWINKNTEGRCIFMENPNSLLMGNNFHGDRLTGKVKFPLKGSVDGKNVSELTSLLQMECIKGFHEIRAVKFSFQGPVNDKSVIKSLTIIVNRSPCRYRICENVEIANSLEVRIAFRRVIKVRRGDTACIEVEAKHIQGYTFLQFDETCDIPTNSHFKCFVASKPKIGKLFFISEVEYGPQINAIGLRNNRGS